MLATATGGVQLAIADGGATSLTMGPKLPDRVEVLATVAGGVPLALALAAAPAVRLKQAGRIEVPATAAGGVWLPPGC